MSADSIRAYAAKLVEQARLGGKSEVTIIAGEIIRDLQLTNRAPAVCSALRSSKFQVQNRVRLTRAEGPKSGMSTTMAFTYDLGSKPGEDSRMDAFMMLRGAGKETFEKLGGGEAWLKAEREAFGGI